MKKTVSAVLLLVMSAFTMMLSFSEYYTGGYFKKLYYENAEDLSLPAFVALEDTSGEKSELLFLNSIPVGEVELVRTKRQRVVLSGEAVGIKLLSRGVLVIKTDDVDGFNPAESAGIKSGDIILSVNGLEVSSNEEIEKIIEKTEGSEAVFEISRGGRTINIALSPRFSPEDGEYKAGLWVRDSCAGIGTMTFYSKDLNAYAALGHPICDSDTGETFEISSGAVCKAEITGFTKACEGAAGELDGSFLGGDIGEISKNSDSGIYGLYNGEITGEEIEVAFKQEVKKGKATIISTVEGDEPQAYECRIEQIITDGEKNLVVRITDKELLQKTGGILQGMSGSPIIQDGRLVGAVTHVMLESSELGYGIFAETMINKLCEEFDEQNQKAAA